MWQRCENRDICTCDMNSVYLENNGNYMEEDKHEMDWQL